ncbi:hypothetical protein RUM44_011116 [Polyplax serrata]|uniref:Uncharacterized protein n=1 Tax=Polyplax serrata TaxID=468196 RepID=A0ABR1APT5_POLSC
MLSVMTIRPELRESGTVAEYMDNVFVTKTFTNHHSIATGVYPEFHGVLGNSLYDSYYKKKLGYSYELWHYSNDTLPIWIANEKKGNGRYSGIMMWPGNEYAYSGIKPTYQKAWNYNVTWDKRVDGAIEWILNPNKPANLVLLYIEEPDYHGHSFGVNSPKFTNELKLMDNITKYIMDSLKRNNLTDHVNVFFLSDHGMISTTKNDVIDLRNFVSSDLYDIYEGSPGIHIYPKPGKANIVYNALKAAVKNGSKFRVFKNSEIPDHWHFKNNRRAPPILALADPPHVFQDFYPYVKEIERQWNFTATNTTEFGMHGYDNSEKMMKPYFLAVGPAIKKNYTIEPFKTLDLFSLWSYMCGFADYAKATNGSLETVSKMLRQGQNMSLNETNESQYVGSILLRLLLIGIVVNVAVYFVYRKWYFRKKAYLSRLGDDPQDSAFRQRLLDSDEEA